MTNSIRWRYEEPSRSEVLTAQTRAVGGGKKRCTKGKSCSATCIDPAEICLVEFPVPAANSLSKVRDKVSESLSEKDLEFLGKLREDFKSRRYKEIVDAISYNIEGAYNKARQDIIDYNNGKPDSLKPIKVPITWERVQKISKTYDKAVDAAFERIDRARYLGDRDKFNKEVSKMKGMYDIIGSKLGKTNETKYIKWESYKDTKFLRNMYSSDLKGAKIALRGDDMIITFKVGKNVVSMELTDFGLSFAFKVNGVYAADPDIPRREKDEIASRVKGTFRKVVSNMNEGTVMVVTPYDGDGKGEKRRRAYERTGFRSAPDGSMYGRVSKGKIVGADEKDFSNYTNKGLFNFSI